MKTLRTLLTALCGLLLITAQAAAQGYPSKTIRLIVPFAPGGASDFAARIVAERLSAELGQPIIIDNRAGAAGNIGLEAAATSEPDGYTAFFGNVGTLAVNPAVFGARIQALASQMQPVSLVGTAPDVLVVNNDVPVKTVAEFVEHARKNTGMSFASPGSGSLNRLEMELFRMNAKLDMVHVPYKGGAGQALVDVAGGHVPTMFVPIPAALPLVKAGRVRILAVASSTRLPSQPDTPTLIESGFPKVVGGSWQTIMLPPKTPVEIVNQWHAAIVKVMQREDTHQKLQLGGMEVSFSASPQELGEFIAEERSRWGAVAKASNATVD
jgi:tripartite-type tricarboxylate transporter receptor subunit TctC